MKTKLFILFVFLTVVLGVSYFILQIKSDEVVIKKLSLQKAEFKFKERDVLLKSHINKFDQTVIGIKENKKFIDFVKNSNSESFINELFLSIIKSAPSVVQFRYIDNLGNELIRVDKENNNSFIVPKKQLQNKKHRYYFKDI
ncbi:MAG: hypothetical protein U9R16_06915, partial [Campylobacterota bacterium]|nr:hypothetical protein [Campylobacterota bacterium]